MIRFRLYLMAMLVAGLAAGLRAQTAPALAERQMATSPTMTVAESAEKARPLKVGVKAPDVKVKDEQGKLLELKSLYAEQPLVLIFYRGGWCPFCVRQLADLGTIEEALKAEGFKLAAISPDKPELIKRDAAEKSIKFPIYSDAPADVIKAFGLAFRATYDFLPERSGFDHHILPVPAAYIIDRDGVIRFVHFDPDYRKRIEAAKLLEAAKEVKSKK
jgi:peroxiredoxin